MEIVKLNKNGKVPVIVLEKEYEGTNDIIYPLADHERLANDIECNWELKEKKTIYITELTPKQYLKVERTGMEWDGRPEKEIKAELAKIKFKPAKKRG